MLNKYKDALKNKKILVTGGLGFIGHNLVKSLINDFNCTVIIVDNCFNSNIKTLEGLSENISIINCSVLEKEKWFHKLREVNYIFHLACVQINHSSSDPVLDLSVNALSTLNILEYLKNNDLPLLERFIYSSTTSIFGSSIKLPIDENDAPHILNHYAASKLCAENYVSLYNFKYGLPTVVVRYSNVYGYGQTPNNPYCGVIGHFIHNVLLNNEINVYGDGEQSRDYTFIIDAISATIFAATHPNAVGDVFNIGTCTETTVNKLVEILSNMVKIKKINYLPERDIDNIRRRSISIDKIHRRLGWSPSVNITTGVEETVTWYMKNIIQ